MSFIDTLKFQEDGLIPVIAQDHKTGEILMFAFANKEALENTRLIPETSPTGAAAARNCGKKARNRAMSKSSRAFIPIATKTWFW